MIKAFAAGSPELRRADDYGTDLILVDSPSPGSGQAVRLALARRGRPRGRGSSSPAGSTPTTSPTPIAGREPWGVDVSTGVERVARPKDPCKVKAFIERARAAAPQPYLGPDEMPYDWADE